MSDQDNYGIGLRIGMMVGMIAGILIGICLALLAHWQLP